MNKIINPLQNAIFDQKYQFQTKYKNNTFDLMDFTHLETLITSLETRPDKIRALTDYILLNGSSNQADVANALHKAFNSYSADKKLAIFYTISEILIISSQKRQIVYFKVFGNKLRPFLQVLSLEVKDTRVMKDICRTLDKWQSEEMFAGNFMEKLKAIVKGFYVRIREQTNEQEQSMGFRKYKKTFLMEIKDMRAYKNSYEVYQNYCEYLEIQQKLANLNLEFNKIDFQRTNDNEIHKMRSGQLLKIYDDLRQKLQSCLTKIHISFNNMRSQALEEYETLKRDAGINGEMKRTNSME